MPRISMFTLSMVFLIGCSQQPQTMEQTDPSTPSDGTETEISPSSSSALLSADPNKLKNTDETSDDNISDTSSPSTTSVSDTKNVTDTEATDATAPSVETLFELSHDDQNHIVQAKALPETTDTLLAHLKHFSHLKQLDLSGSLYSPSERDGTGVEHIAHLANIETVDLNFTAISDAGLGLIKLFQELRKLHLRGCENITDDAIIHLSEITHLQNLILPYQIGDQGLAHLKGLREMQDLVLSSTQITDAGLVHVQEMAELHTLQLNGCENLTDTGMVHLSGLKNLQVLNLNATQITDAGLPHLARLTNLQQLDLGNCLKVSMDGIQTLQAELPACTITR
ncbi:MAG: hypothetical protein MK103_13215 [Planctomycetes bacterium]|nr:hypothetical protein [Planctomycetota bacterium]